MMRIIPSLLAAAGLAAAVSFAGPAKAAEFPTGPITVVVPYQAGGMIDAAIRLIADELAAKYGKPVIVENKPGGGTMIGANYVTQAKPDGHTLLYGTTALMLTPLLNPSIDFDVRRDMEPVARVVESPLVLVTSKDLPVETTEELIKYIKENPDKVTAGHAPLGSPPHMAMELFKHSAGIDFVSVPYPSNVAVYLGIEKGDLQMTFVDPLSSKPHYDAGKIKVLGTTYLNSKSPIYPDKPTIAESGLEGFEVDSFFGLLAPKGTPPEIIAKLNSDVREVMQAKAVRDSLALIGMEGPILEGPELFAEKINSFYASFEKLVNEVPTLKAQ